jgi:hypothetical protein
MSFKIDAPVVVKPETVSKKASTKSGMEPEKRYGKEPNKEIAIHVKTTEKNVSLTEYSVTSFLVKINPENPEKKVSKKDINKEILVVSL